MCLTGLCTRTRALLDANLIYDCEYPIRYPPKPVTQSRIGYAIHRSSPPSPKDAKGLASPMM